MKKLTSKDIHRLATHPAALARFQATGRIDQPNGPRDTPLLQLLRQLPAPIAARFQAVEVGPALGFQHVRRNPFRDANAILHWLQNETHGPGPGNYLSGFRGPVTLNELQAASRQAPDLDWLQAHFPRLCRRARPAPASDPSL